MSHPADLIDRLRDSPATLIVPLVALAVALCVLEFEPVTSPHSGAVARAEDGGWTLFCQR